MPKSYSTYEAKAKFSEILRGVREHGESVVVSYHGRPVAEIRPVPQPDGESLADRLGRMGASGVLAQSSGERPKLRRIARRRGALSRFLAERDG